MAASDSPTTDCGFIGVHVGLYGESIFSFHVSVRMCFLIGALPGRPNQKINQSD